MTPNAPAVQLEMFEGPLDLLLHLIKKNEVEIADIPIATITDQYLAMLEANPALNLDGAGEYLVMAATLAYLKSRALLPEPDPDPEDAEEDPQQALVQQLLEYQRFREVAVALGERPLVGRDVFATPPEPVPPPAPGEQVPLPVREAAIGDLLGALREVLRRRRPSSPHEILRPHRSVGECVELILARFAVESELEFSTLFEDDADRGDVVVTFLALLELIRVGVVRARQDERFGPIQLVLAVDDLEEATERVRVMGALATARVGEAGDGDGPGGGGDGTGDGSGEDVR